METKIRIIRPDGEEEVRDIDMPRDPGYVALRELLAPLLDRGPLERVVVLADFEGGNDFAPTDMFVDENGHLKSLPRNEKATSIYRCASLQRSPDMDPESIPFIVGPAVLFNRRVWF
jgi:hypothetical protein